MGTETVEAVLTKATESAAPGQQAVERRLAEPVKITVTKTPVYVVYPMTYVQTFNGRPYEIVATTKKCVDSSSAADPTCGWFLREDGTKIPGSQGYCCACDSKDTIGDSFGNGSGDQRTPLDCSLWRNGLFIGGKPASAHCLRMNRTWFPTYSVGEGSLQFQIQVTISSVYSSSNTSIPVNTGNPLILGPSTPSAALDDGAISAKLIGDFMTYTQLPVLTSYHVSIPSSTSTSAPPPGADGSPGGADIGGWMLLDKSLYTMDGSECNKIGTSFGAFQYEPDKCRRQVGSCLANQLLDLLEEDSQRVRRGGTPRYLLSSRGAVQPLVADSGDVSIAIPVLQQLNSLITLELQADDVRFLVNRSPGRIVLAETQAFEALTSSGRISVQIQNNGTIAADYTVTVQNCSTGIQPIGAQVRSIAAGQFSNFTFTVNAQDGMEAERSCIIVLYDAVSTLSDSVQVRFTTTATKDDRGAQGGGSDGKVPGNSSMPIPNKPLAPSEGSSAGGCAACQSFDFGCFAGNRCWGDLAKAVGAIAGGLIGIAAVVGAVLFLHQAGFLLPLLLRALQCCGCCIASGARNGSIVSSSAQRKRTGTWEDEGHAARGASTSVCIVYGAGGVGPAEESPAGAPVGKSTVAKTLPGIPECATEFVHPN